MRLQQAALKLRAKAEASAPKDAKLVEFGY